MGGRQAPAWAASFQCSAHVEHAKDLARVAGGRVRAHRRLWCVRLRERPVRRKRWRWVARSAKGNPQAEADADTAANTDPDDPDRDPNPDPEADAQAHADAQALAAADSPANGSHLDAEAQDEGGPVRCAVSEPICAHCRRRVRERCDELERRVRDRPKRRTPAVRDRRGCRLSRCRRPHRRLVRSGQAPPSPAEARAPHGIGGSRIRRGPRSHTGEAADQRG